MSPRSFFNKSLTALAAFFLFNAAALSYLPAVHGALHAHEDVCPESKASEAKDLCSAQNHLAADLSSETTSDIEALLLPQTLFRVRPKRAVFFANLIAGPRAPPASSVQ